MLDLFFVLSGYLIAGLLIKEYARTGTIKLWRFSRRRIRRLAPAATTVIVFTIAAGYLVFPLARANSVAVDGVWAMLLSANWHFILTGTDYFSTWLPQSPLLHYWSLAVEEQFYLFWPLLLISVLTLGARLVRARRGRSLTPTFLERYGLLLVVIFVVSAASFAWSVVQSNSHPEVSYLSTLTRVWELGFGALLYFGNVLWAKIPFPARVTLTWLGLAVLVASSFYLTPATPYPGLAAIVPVLASSAIIVSGVGGPAGAVALTNPVSRYLGQISYSVYLWHWPIFVIIAALLGKQSGLYLYGSIPIALFVGALSFHLLEDPIRRSSWLEPSAKWRRMTSWQRFDRASRIVAVIAIPVAAMVIVASMFALNRPSQRPETPTVVEVEEPGSETSSTGSEAELEPVQASIIGALNAEQWPAEIVQQIDSGEYLPTGLLNNHCLDVKDANLGECRVGDPTLPRSAVVLGDSVALSWMPGLGPALNDLGYHVQLLSHSQCPAADVSVSGSFGEGAVRPGYPKACNEHRAWALDQVDAAKPDLVIIADGEAEMQTLMLPDDTVTKKLYWQQGMERTLERLDGSQVVILASPPQAESVTECYTRVASVEDCTGRIDKQWREQIAAVAVAVEAKGSKAALIDTQQWFCSVDSWCPPFALESVIRSDRQHLTQLYASRLTPLLRETIRETDAGE